MAALATVEEFQARHGLLADGDLEVVEALLDDATNFIRGEAVGSEADWAQDDAPDDAVAPPIVRTICIQAAYRAWRNPDGVAREEIGEIARTFRGGHESDAMWLTKNEMRMIRKAANRSTVRSIPVETPYAGPAESPYDLYPGHGEGIGE
jgi:hypothetical protein